MIGVSFVLSVAVTAGLVRSYFAYDQLMHVSWNDAAKRYLGYEMFWYRGRIILSRDGMTISPGSIYDMWHARSPAGWKYFKNEAESSPIYYDFRWWSFRTETPRGVVGRIVQFGFNGWVLAALFAVLPSTWAMKRIRRQPPPGTCRKCGYDLRASPDYCPECGTTTAKV
jgi:hypothetical protein